MAIKKWVRLTCDGPCGTVIEDNHAPEGWALLQITDNKGQKWTHREHLCPACQSRLMIMMERGGYSFTIPQAEEKAVL